MQGDQAISWLMFFTLAAGVIFAGGGFLYFLRHHRNREIASHALVEPGNRRYAATQGAFPEIGAVAAILVFAMGLLTAGYLGRSNIERSQSARSTNNGMAESVGIADTSKPYQPANPAPDKREAPTSSDTGIGSANGAKR